ADARLVTAISASVAVSRVRRSIRLVSHAVSGEPMHNTTAPSNPASRMVTSSPADSSLSMPAGARTAVPLAKFPSIRAVGANRRWTWTWSGGAFMQVHVGDASTEWKNEARALSRSEPTSLRAEPTPLPRALGTCLPEEQNAPFKFWAPCTRRFACVGRLQRANRLLYRSFPLTSARSQE